MKRILAIILSIVLLIGVLPLGALTASAATSYVEGYYYTVSNGEATITSCDITLNGDITIPSTLGGYPVTSIGNYVFYYYSSLTSVTIPNSVTSIGDYAFYNCINLTSVTIQDSVTLIGAYAFYCCSSLTSITIPNSVTTIDSYTFCGCSSLESITIPDGVTSIKRHAFNGCSRLTNIIIPKSVTSVDDSAFYFCNNLEKVYYCGTEEEWNEIGIKKNNEKLQSANINYNSTGFEIVCDLNNDSYVNASDISLLRKDLLTTSSNNLSYDINNDGEVNIIDLVKLKKQTLGMV